MPKTLVSLCTDCEAYEVPPEKTCPGCDKKLHPRLVYICQDCTDKMCFLTLAQAKAYHLEEDHAFHSDTE